MNKRKKKYKWLGNTQSLTLLVPEKMQVKNEITKRCPGGSVG